MSILDDLFPVTTPDSGVGATRAVTIGSEILSIWKDVAPSIGSGIQTGVKATASNWIAGIFKKFSSTKTGQEVTNQITQDKIKSALSNPTTWIFLGAAVFGLLFLGRFLGKK